MSNDGSGLWSIVRGSSETQTFKLNKVERCVVVDKFRIHSGEKIRINYLLALSLQMQIKRLSNVQAYLNRSQSLVEKEDHNSN